MIFVAMLLQDLAEYGLNNRNDILLYCDFERDNWAQPWGSGAPMNAVAIDGKEAFGRGKSLKVTIQKGSNYGTSLEYKFRARTGSEPEEMYFRYYVKFDPDWKKGGVFGGKLPGFGGTYGRAGWGGRKVNGTDGWSARGGYDYQAGSDSYSINFYCYHADMKGTYGDNFVFKPRLSLGAWYCVEMYCKLNTPGQGGGKGKNDGILRGWLNGELAVEKTDIRFRDVDTLKIEDVWVNIYHGGTAVAKEDCHVYLDNMVIARKYIGPMTAQPARAESQPQAPGGISPFSKNFIPGK